MKSIKKSLALFLMLLLGAGSLSAAETSTVKGRVLCGGSGVEGVLVSDGHNVVKTDKNGAYELAVDLSESDFVHISVPSGYEVERKGNYQLFFGRLDTAAKGPQTFDFNLKKVDQSVYTLFTLADTHVCGGTNNRSNSDDAKLYSSQLMPALRECLANSEGPAYIVTLGDMTQPGYRPQNRVGKENPGYGFADYMRDTDVDVPIFNVIGNHDHDTPKKGTAFTESTIRGSRRCWYEDLGPVYYSFTIGREHYIVLDNTFVLTSDAHGTADEKATTGNQVRLCNAQANWLKNHMAAIDRSTFDRVVLCMHCPLLNANGGFSMMRTHQLLEPISGCEIVALIGHSHRDRSVRTWQGGRIIYEFIHPSTAGVAWYSPINTEGTPGAVVTYKFKGKNIERKYHPYGSQKGVQYRVYDNADHAWSYPINEITGSYWSHAREVENGYYKHRPAILVTIWNAYSCKFTESSGGKGEVTKGGYDLTYRDWYWSTYEKSLNGEIPEGQTLRRANWQTPSKSSQVWRYVPADPKAVVTVEAKDVFGNVIATFTAQASR